MMLAAQGALNAQFTKGSKEISVSGSLGSYTYTRKSPGGSSSSRDYQYFTVYLSPGYYITNGLSVEPEVAYLFQKDNTPAQFYLLNLSYTARLGEGKTGLFFRAGYGMGNSMIFTGNNDIPLQLTKSMDVKIINAGAGLKVLLNENVLARIELNYRVNSYSDDSYYYYYPYGPSSGRYEYTYSNVSLIFGFAYLLP
jgi:hypothetical protein